MIEEFNKYCKKTDSISQPLGYLTIYNRKSEIEVFGDVYKGFLSLLNQLIYHLDTAVLQVKKAALSAPLVPEPQVIQSTDDGGGTIFPPSRNQPWTFISSVNDGRLLNPKGDLKCKTNFYKHYS